MTTAEIKALLERAKDEVEDCSETQCDLMAAVHTLLARQAEVMEEIMFDYSLHSENVRAILCPENET